MTPAIANHRAKPDEKGTMTTGQVCKIFGVSPSTVHKWLDNGTLLGFTVPNSRARRYYKASVMAKAKEAGIFSPSDQAERGRVLIVGGAHWVRQVGDAIGGNGLSALRVTNPGDLFAASQSSFRAAVIDLATYGRSDGLSLGRQIREHVGCLVVGTHGDDEADPSALDDSFTVAFRSSEMSPAAVARFVREQLSK